ncbi:TIR domain-containing protein [Solwaraspora sp. WMMA2056]|uniref:P-loop NTPase n=1 Tax=Solwaraspora sp. WMMA2056 TaxID=3015161 RepID=UPI00259B5B6F|nr:TIR domain-containing protein [Solwaraspora sp. WMMA2056]WJK41295.1 TIR domain-containing protein [Solwaraspora sp. WMMA2056]
MTVKRHGIFLNFRSRDGGYPAALLDGELTRIFGDEHVFRSSRSIPPGATFPEVLRAALDQSCVLLAVIGPDWLRRGEDGRRLIDQDGDWVRAEIATALKARIPVIPVLLDDTQRPAADALPGDIAGLADCQAVYLRSRHIDPDLPYLVGKLWQVAPALTAHRVFTPPPGPDEEEPPSVLLRPERAAVPFHGRVDELRRLHSWATTGTDTAVCLVTGPAGQGKSRLARQFAESMSRAGWVAGFLHPAADDEDVRRLRELHGRLLIVVDNAEGEAVRVGSMLAALAGRAPRSSSTRVLMVARSPGLWLETLSYAEQGPVTLSEVETITLGPPEALTRDPRQELRRALLALAAHLQVPESEALRIWNATHQNVLAQAESMLALHTTALNGLLDNVYPIRSLGDGGPSTSRADRDTVRHMLAHERRYWRRSAQPFELPDPYIDRLDAVVCAATLFGGEHPDEAEAVLAALPTMRGERGHVIDRYLRWVRHMQPPAGGAEGQIAPSALRPDLVGEELVAMVLASQPGLATPAWPLLSPTQALRTLLVLGRAAPRHPHLLRYVTEFLSTDAAGLASVGMWVADQLDQPMLRAAVVETVLRAGDPDTAAFLNGRWPFSAGHPTDSRLLDLAATAGPAARADQTARIATDRLRGLVRRAAQGGARDVLPEAAELVEQLRHCSEPGDLASRRALGHAVSVWGDCLLLTGARESAVTAIQEAVSIRRELSRRHPLPGPGYPTPTGASGLSPRTGAGWVARLLAEDLAQSVWSLGHAWSAVNRYEEAAQAFAETSQLYNTLMLAILYVTAECNSISATAAMLRHRHTLLSFALRPDALESVPLPRPDWAGPGRDQPSAGGG